MTMTASDRRKARLCKHADYQRVYEASRKQFSASMTYFCRVRPQEAAASDGISQAQPESAAARVVRRGLPEPACARVGLTAGRVMGKAVERNRIKRRMRAAVRMHLEKLPAQVDVVLHPRKSVMEMEFAQLEREVGELFSKIAARVAREGDPYRKLPGDAEPRRVEKKPMRRGNASAEGRARP